MSRIVRLSLLIALSTTAFISAFAGIIPYPNPGTIAPTIPVFATATGDVTGYFYGYHAGDIDYIRMYDVTSGYTSGYTFENNKTPVGSSFDFGPVTAGDVIVFELRNLSYPRSTFASLPSLSADGINHAYITTYSGGYAGIPAGIFVGMEDMPHRFSDLDYNDDQYVFTNVNESPEPGTLIMFGSGFLGMVAVVRRKINL